MADQCENLAEELLGTLGELAGIYHSLEVLNETKRRTLEKDDMVALQALVREEEGLAIAIEELEQRRLKVQSSLLGNCDLTLAQTIEQLPAFYQDQGRHFLNELRNAVANVDRERLVNAEIIRHCFNFKRQRFQRFFRAPTAPGYGASGNMTEHQMRQAVVDRKI